MTAANMDLQFSTLDVFTSTRYQGNPLAVVSVPTALRPRLTQDIKQRIVKEFNLSETVFLHERASSSSKQQEIDIFTTEREIPFAGHPTIGTAVFLRHYRGGDGDAGVETLVTKAGPIGLLVAENNDAAAAADGPPVISANIPHDIRLHGKTLRDVLRAASGGAGGGGRDHLLPTDPQIREAELDAPVFSIVNGMAFALIRLPSLELLGKVGRPQINLVTEGSSSGGGGPVLDEGWRNSFVGRYYYVDTGVEEEGKTRCIRTRMMELQFEDAATGSAASALAAYLSTSEEAGEASRNKYRITQGVEMGRKSVIDVETTTEVKGQGTNELKDLWLGGTAVVVMKGTLTVDA